jgi:cysteinyl-tRNA synthetase
MDDDFNTSEAIAVLFELAREVNKAKTEDMDRAAQLGAALRRLGGLLGLLQDDPEVFLKGADRTNGGLAAHNVERLLEERAEARRRKDFAEADRIRDLLVDNGIVIEDGPTGTSWRRG